MISIFRARKVLGKNGKEMPDEQIEELLHECYMLAEVMFEHFKIDEKFNNARKQKNS
jgi:hypothetical protein